MELEGRRRQQGSSQMPGGKGWLLSEQGLALQMALAALLLRLIYLLESAGNPFRQHLGLDPANYHRWAQTILDGTPFGPEPFFQAPLYPYFLAACYALLGIDPVRPLWIQLILAAATTYFGARIGYRYWGRTGLLAVGLLLALYKPAIFYSGVLLVPILATFLLAAALWYAPQRPLLGGLLVGLATLAHPTVLPGGILAILGLSVARRRQDPGNTVTSPGWRRRWLPARTTFMKMILGVILAILPATIHNAAVSGRFVPMSVNAGINLYIGNGPGANGFYRSPFGMRGERDPLGIAEATRQSGRKLDPIEASRFWTEQTRAAVRAQPSRALRLYLQKLYLALGAHETPQIESLDFEKRYSHLMRFPLLPNWIFLLALSALALALSSRRILPATMLAATLLTAITMAIFFVTGRFRLPAHLFLAIAAGGGIAQLLSRRPIVTVPSRRRILIALCGGVAVVLLLGPNWLRIETSRTFGQYHYRLGLLAEKRHDFDQAMTEYAAALAIDPDIARANTNLGILTARQDDLQAARKLLEHAISLDPRGARASLALGQIEQMEDNLAGACRLYAQAWAADSTFPRTLEYLATATYLHGNAARAESLALELIDRVGTEDPLARRCFQIARKVRARRRHMLDIWSSRQRAEGDLAMALRDYQIAARWFLRALEVDPGDRGAVLELARIANLRGDSARVEELVTRFLDIGGPPEAVSRLRK